MISFKNKYISIIKKMRKKRKKKSIKKICLIGIRDDIHGWNTNIVCGTCIKIKILYLYA